jgi:nucleotide-binding universal stress UspA family protein
VAKIVVAVDGSEPSKEALRWALEEALLRDAEIVAVHAWQPVAAVPEPGPAPGFDVVSVLPELEEAAKRLVNGVVDEVVGENPDVTVERVAREGRPVEVLADAARDADLLVVGSRGLGGFRALLLGSVSQQLAHHAPCPLLIYRRAD